CLDIAFVELVYCLPGCKVEAVRRWLGFVVLGSGLSTMVMVDLGGFLGSWFWFVVPVGAMVNRGR
ncbi:unnamed protein product, partial [Ilex paraguariensis]